MISRAVYKEQRARKPITALAIIALVTGILAVSANVLAVAQTGAFELEGNAVTEAGVAGNDDWDRVCYEQAIEDGLTAAQAQALCTANQGTTGATATTWVDATANPTIFTGGGSKDPQDVSSWLWKPKDTVPDKDTIRHAFAARYSLPKDAANCPAPATSTTCEVVFFGMDRFANDGDAQLGLWFFQNPIGLTNISSQGGLKFSGVHQENDLLLISNFSNGGTVATISAYFWDTSCAKAANNDPQPGQCAAANLRLQATANNAKCDTSAPEAAFCGIVNPADGTTAPWPYTDKKGNSTYLQGEFYEGGVNLSALGIGDECFSSVLAESRASTSPTSVLKDFVLGQFAQCSATITTTPSVGSGTEVSPGTSVTDIAVIQGMGTGNPPTPTGNVTFFLCQFAAGSTDLCDGTTGKVGTQVGSPVALADSSPPAGEATATSAAVNTAGSPLAPGRYCFRAEWPGDTNYLPPTPPGKFVHFGTGNAECFVVRATSSITMAQKWLPQDTATVTTTGGVTVSGSVTFSLYENGTCSGTPVATFTDTTVPFETNNTTYYTESKIISWSAVFTPSDPNAVQGSTTTRCERSDLTINNSASDFPPPAP